MVGKTDKYSAMSACPSEEIAAYIDGELGTALEADMDAHFSVCQVCSFELNQQKRFLMELDAGLSCGDTIKLPHNFAKVIVANAESNVNGLRCSGERYDAFFVCAGLALFTLFVLGPDASRIIAGFGQIFEQMTIIGGFFGHLVYSLFWGVVIVIRSVAAQTSFDMVYALIMPFVAIISLAAASKRILRMRRI